MTDPKYLLIGEILRPHGVRGELRMRVLTDYPERIAKLKTVYLAHNPDKDEVVSHVVKHVRMHQDYALLTLNDVPDRNHAEHLRGLFVMVGLQDAIPLEEDEVYLYQLIGMEVHTEQGDFLGTVTDVLETGANDVYIVQSEQYGEVLIPVTGETILDTDTETNRITVRLPDGLLPS